MDPTTAVCLHLACPARGHIGQGHMGLHTRQDRRCICPQCRKTCSATQGLGFSRLRPAAETVVLGVTLRAPGCPVPVIVAAWGARSGRQRPAVHEPLVEPPRDLG